MATTASTYTINFTDSVHRAPLIITNGNANTSTSLTLPGPNYRNYGPVISENYLHLLEHFANAVAPYPPVKGQLWYDTSSSGKLKINTTGSAEDWIPANGIYQQNSAPATASVGDVWVNTSAQQLNIYNGVNWLLIGPQFANGLMSGTKAETIIDTNGASHIVVKEYVSGDVISIIAKASFTPALVISGFTSLLPGVNLTKSSFKGVASRFNGISTSSDALQVSSSVAVKADQFVRKDVGASAQIMATNLTFSDTNMLRFGDVVAPVLAIAKTSSGAVTLSTLQSSGQIIFSAINSSESLTPAFVIQGKSDKINHYIGINTDLPLYELDVHGALGVSGAGNISGTLTVGGLNVTGQTNFNGTIGFVNTVTSVSIKPLTSSTYDIGTVTNPYRTIYANSFAGAATRLTTPSRIKLSGQLASNDAASSALFYGDGADVIIEAQFSTSTISGQPNWDDIAVNSSTSILVSIDSGSTATTGVYSITKGAFLQDVMPAGSVLLWGGNSTPPGWLLCDGSRVSVTTYPDLYDAIQTTYGVLVTGTVPLPTLTTPVSSPAFAGRNQHNLFYIIKY